MGKRGDQGSQKRNGNPGKRSKVKAPGVQWELSLWLSRRLIRRVRRALTDPKGVVLVSSAPGMGRTRMAHFLAQSTAAQQGLGMNRVSRLNCGDFAAAEDQVGDLCRAVMAEVARGSVLVIEECHLLGSEGMAKLGVLVCEQQLRDQVSDSGRIPGAQRSAFFLTALVGTETECLQSLSSGGESMEVQHLPLPLFRDLLPEIEDLLNFMTTEAFRGVGAIPAPCFVTDLLEKVRLVSGSVTLHRLSESLVSAAKRACREGRQVVHLQDFDAEWCKDGSADLACDSEIMRQFMLPRDDGIGIEPWRDLYATVRNGSLEEATQLVRRIMIDYAMVTHRGNKTKVAHQLGVARQHLYKPCLRSLHLDGEERS